MWYSILMALKTHLAAQDSLKDVVIQVGGSADIPEKTTIILTRGTFEPKTTEPKSLESQNLYIECWCYDESENFATGYSKLATLEADVLTAINAFGAGTKQISNKNIRVRLGQTEPDGDAFRPSVGSRTAVSIRWQ